MKTDLMRISVYVVLVISLLIGPFGLVSAGYVPDEARLSERAAIKPELALQAERNLELSLGFEAPGYLNLQRAAAIQAGEDNHQALPAQEVIDKTRQLAEGFDCATVTDVPAAECEALVALYVSTNGAGWNDSTNWLASPLVSRWYGVEVADGHVTYIELENNRMSGSIPAELDDLSALLSLNLSYNILSGSIPAELGGLSTLKGLYLYSNQLNGSIPPALGSLQLLQELSLSSNQLSGSIPAELGGLSTLKSLYLFSNQLSGNIPAELGQLSALTRLSLDNNQLSGSIPAELGQLSALEFLSLSWNQLSGSIPAALGNLHSLQELFLSNNQLSGSIPAELVSISSLSSLCLNNNQLSGSIPAALGSLGSLGYLKLNNNQLSGNIPATLSYLRLHVLDLSFNQLSGSIPAGLSQLSTLSYLYLNNNQLSGSIPAELGQLSELYRLYLNNNQLSGSIPAELGQLSELNYLYLNNNQLSGSIPLTFVNLTALLSFNFKNTFVCEPSSEAFLSWKQTVTVWKGTDTVCEATGDASWLLMYYGAGDNELDEVIANEVNEITRSRHQNVDIAIFLDSVSRGSFYRFYKNNGVQEEIEKPDINSGDGSSLSDFMNWATSISTAPRQALIIAGHGHGLSGVARDDRANQDSIFVNGELRNALLVNGPVDVVYGHAGLMGNLEFMWELRGLSDYYVSSESASFCTHHDYIRGIGPDTTAEELAVSIAESYDGLRNSGETPSTISVVDMGYLDEVFVATNNLAKTILEAPSDLKTNLWGVLGHTSLQRFDERFPNGINDDDRLADLFDFADLARSFDELSIAAQALIDLQNNFVIDNRAWSGEYYDGAPWAHDNASGVSIAMPLSPMLFYDGAWLEFATGADWTFTGAVTQPPTVVEGFNWGPMVSDLVELNNADGEDDVNPPELAPLLGWYRAYLPLVLKSAAQ